MDDAEGRIQQLESYLEWWSMAIAAATKKRDELIRLKKLGLTMIDKTGKDVLPERIHQEEKAVREFEAGRDRIQAELERARHGNA